MRKLAVYFGICALAVSAALDVSARTLKNNESLPATSVEGDALRVFKESVESKTNGELEIRLHFNDELGDPKTSLENLGTGTLELYSGALSYYSALIPETLGVSSLLYLFKDSDHLRRYLKSPVFAKGHERMIKDFGIRFISTDFSGDRGPYRIWLSKKPALTIDDFVGVKMRLWPNDMAIRAWKHIGAVPTVMPWNEVYLALRQGRVDAVTSGVNGAHDSKLTEVVPHVTVLRQFPQVWPIAISEQVWQSLTAEQQKIVEDAANEATLHYAQVTYEMAEANIQKMIQENGATWSRINTDPFAEKMKPFYQSLIEDGVVSQEVYDEVSRLR